MMKEPLKVTLWYSRASRAGASTPCQLLCGNGDLARHTENQTGTVEMLCMARPTYEDEKSPIKGHHRKVKDPDVARIE